VKHLCFSVSVSQLRQQFLAVAKKRLGFVGIPFAQKAAERVKHLCFSVLVSQLRQQFQTATEKLFGLAGTPFAQKAAERVKHLCLVVLVPDRFSDRQAATQIRLGRRNLEAPTQKTSDKVRCDGNFDANLAAQGNSGKHTFGLRMMAFSVEHDSF
jgi:hypothetical protein